MSDAVPGHAKTHVFGFHVLCSLLLAFYSIQRFIYVCYLAGSAFLGDYGSSMEEDAFGYYPVFVVLLVHALENFQSGAFSSGLFCLGFGLWGGLSVFDIKRVHLRLFFEFKA